MGLIAFSLADVPVYSYGLIVLGAILLGTVAAGLNARLQHKDFHWLWICCCGGCHWLRHTGAAWICAASL